LAKNWLSFQTPSAPQTHQLPYSVTPAMNSSRYTDLPSTPALIRESPRRSQAVISPDRRGLRRHSGRIQAPVNRLGRRSFQSAREAIEKLKNGSLFKFEWLTAFLSATRIRQHDQPALCGP